MAKGYWVTTYRGISKPDNLAAYAKLAGPAIEAGGGKFVVRGGIGLYNQQHLLFYINKVELEGAGGTTTVALAGGSPLMPTFPNILPSVLVNAPPRDIQQLAPEFRNPYSLQATLGVEQQVAGVVIGADYIYLRGHDLMSLIDINAPVSNVKPNIRTVAQADATRSIAPVVGGVRKIVQLATKAKAGTGRSRSRSTDRPGGCRRWGPTPLPSQRIRRTIFSRRTAETLSQKRVAPITTSGTISRWDSPGRCRRCDGPCRVSRSRARPASRAAGRTPSSGATIVTAHRKTTPGPECGTRAPPRAFPTSTWR